MGGATVFIRSRQSLSICFTAAAIYRYSLSSATHIAHDQLNCGALSRPPRLYATQQLRQLVGSRARCWTTKCLEYHLLRSSWKYTRARYLKFRGAAEKFHQQGPEEPKAVRARPRALHYAPSGLALYMAYVPIM